MRSRQASSENSISESHTLRVLRDASLNVITCEGTRSLSFGVRGVGCAFVPRLILTHFTLRSSYCTVRMALDSVDSCGESDTISTVKSSSVRAYDALSLIGRFPMDARTKENETVSASANLIQNDCRGGAY